MKVKNICCIGAGYVGGPTMAVIALKSPGIKVTVVDLNSERIDAWNGPIDQLPIYEPGLGEVVKEARGRNLFFSTNIDKAIDEAQMIFMAVNTPTKTEGEGAGMAADLRYFISSAKHIAQVAKDDKIIVEKSTLPVRTAEKVKEILEENNKSVKFEILSNPEFLAEGTAIEDLFKSDRVLVGGDSTKSGKIAVNALVDIYANWIPRGKILTTNVWSSELAKLASNAMLAQRISSVNSLSALCEKTGADIDELSLAMGMDHRIGPKFLQASVGFGGSCFQKDILNLVYLCKHYGLDEVAEYWHQVVKINDYQKKRFAEKIKEELGGSLEGHKIAILGWAFKKDTNDSRESAAIYITDYLIQFGARVNVYDPMVEKSQIKNDLISLWTSKGLSYNRIEQLLEFCNIHSDVEEVVLNTSVIAIITEWDEFKAYDWHSLKRKMIDPSIIFDGRNILESDQFSSELIIKSIGKI